MWSLVVLILAFRATESLFSALLLVAVPAKALPQPGTCNQGRLPSLLPALLIREPFVTGAPLGLASMQSFIVDGIRMLPARRLLG